MLFKCPVISDFSDSQEPRAKEDNKEDNTSVECCETELSKVNSACYDCYYK